MTTQSPKIHLQTEFVVKSGLKSWFSGTRTQKIFSSNFFFSTICEYFLHTQLLSANVPEGDFQLNLIFNSNTFYLHSDEQINHCWCYSHIYVYTRFSRVNQSKVWGKRRRDDEPFLSGSRIYFTQHTHKTLFAKKKGTKRRWWLSDLYDEMKVEKM